MREDLAREFPGAVRAIASTRARVGGRRPVLWSEPVVWAAISGIGAGFLVTAVVGTLVGLTSEAFQTLRSPMPFTLVSWVTVAGSAAGAAVALAASGPLALALDLAYVALGVALGIPGVQTFCEQNQLGFQDRSMCGPFGLVMSVWPQLVGIGLGVAFARTLRARGTGINSLLRIAGGYAIALFVVSHLWGATVARTTSVLASELTFAAGAVAAAVAAGVIAAQLPRSIRNATIVAGISLLPWLTLQLPLGLQSLGRTVPAEYVSLILVSIAIQPIAAAFLVLSAAVAARSRFIPRDTA